MPASTDRQSGAETAGIERPGSVALHSAVGPGLFVRVRVLARGGIRVWAWLGGCLACGVVYAWSGATRRREREFPGRDECCWPSVAMHRIATKSLLI